jgi:hypothetical protein
VSVQLALCVQDAGRDRARFRRLEHIIAQLSVQKPLAVSSSDAQFHAQREIQKGGTQSTKTPPLFLSRAQPTFNVSCRAAAIDRKNPDAMALRQRLLPAQPA